MKWSEEELKILKDLYPTTNIGDLLKLLQRTKIQILNKARKLGLKKSKDYVRTSNNWSQNEIDYLLENFSKMKTINISKKLSRSYDEVRWMVNKLELKKDPYYISKVSTERNIERSGDIYNIEKLKEISKKYYTRGQFLKEHPNAYNTACKRGILDEVCQHMFVGKYSTPQLIMKYILEELFQERCFYNDRKTIKPYELDVYFPARKVAFEFNGIFWHKNDGKKKLNKVKLCKEKDIALFIIEERNQNYFEDIHEQLSNILNCEININPDYDKIFENIYTYEKIKNEIKKYDSLEILKVENPKLYNKIHTMNIYKEITSHIKRKRVRKWLEEDAVSIISEFKNMKEFLQEYGNTLYRWIKRNNKEHLICILKTDENI